jgi:dTDP-4-dehydrorhamnose 3,5-epimerase
MNVDTTPLPGLKVITPSRFADERGWFSESWNRDRMEAAGLNYDFVQDNHSLSETKHIVRGLHFQTPPRAQAKLVRCGRGKLFDVAVDIRFGSPTYGHWFGVELSPENGKQLLIPTGFMHGFVTLAPNTEIIYKCSDFYSPDHDQTVRWDDPAIGINWHLDGHTPLLSDKDRGAPVLSEIDNFFTYPGTDI